MLSSMFIFRFETLYLTLGGFHSRCVGFRRWLKKVEREVCGPSSFSTRALTLYAPHAYTSGSEIQLSPLKFREY